MRISKILVISMLIVLFVLSISYADDRVSLGFMYGWTGNIDLIDRTNGGINQVSPTCLDLTDKGDLYVTSNLTHDFVTKMHERGILVIPFLSNHWAKQKGKNAVNNAERLSDQILETIIEYNLDGVNVDIENLDSEDRNLLNEFVRLLSEKIPEEKILSVSVAANPFDKQTGWQGSYDYDKLGEYADYLFIMTYDEHSQGGPQGPVSSTYFFEKSILYALEHVSKDKIVVGIPFFGRYWKLVDEETSEYRGGEAVVIGAMPNLIENNEGEVLYEELVGEASYTFTVNNSISKTTINGKELSDGTYVAWYQTNEGIRDKLWLINFYDLLGAGVWALGQEKAEIWDYYYTRLNEKERIPDGMRYAMLELEEKSDANKESFAVIYEQWLEDMKAIKDLSGTPLFEFGESRIVRNPHIHEEIITDVDYVKTKENVKEKENKKQNENESNNKNAIHRFRFESKK